MMKKFKILLPILLISFGLTACKSTQTSNNVSKPNQVEAYNANNKQILKTSNKTSITYLSDHSSEYTSNKDLTRKVPSNANLLYKYQLIQNHPTKSTITLSLYNTRDLKINAPSSPQMVGKVDQQTFNRLTNPSSFK